MAEIDRSMWGPTLELSRADRVTRAVKAAASWDDAIVRSGVLEFIRELEHEGRTKPRLADTVAGWHGDVEGARDAFTNACVELIATSLVAVGGGPRRDRLDTTTRELSLES
jgi:hypothetical protein